MTHAAALTALKPRKHTIGDLIGKMEAMNGKINATHTL